MESSVCVCECSFLAVPDWFQVYNGQSNFIENMTSNSTFSNFGLPIDNVLTDISTAVSSWCFYYLKVLSTDGVLGWNLFAAAAMTSNEDARSQLILKVHNRANYNLSAGVFPVEYGSADGSTLRGVAR